MAWITDRLTAGANAIRDSLVAAGRAIVGPYPTVEDWRGWALRLCAIDGCTVNVTYRVQVTGIRWWDRAALTVTRGNVERTVTDSLESRQTIPGKADAFFAGPGNYTFRLKINGDA